MLYGYDKERGDQAILKEIEARRKAAALFPIIREVVTRFDGKVFNCRLENALREYGRIWCRKRMDWLEITADCGENYRYCYMLAQIRIDAMPDGKRIPADLIIESARQKRAEHLKRAAEAEESMKEIETHQKHMEYLLNQFEKLRDSIPYNVREAYGLDFRICRS